MKTLLLFLTIVFISMGLFGQETSTLKLKGKTYRQIDTLILLKSTEDVRFQGIEIPVKEDSTFEYKMEIGSIEEYQLIFKEEHSNGMWKPILFFPDAETISFTLFPPEEFDKNIIEGSVLTNAKLKYKEEKFTLFSEKMNHWYEILYTPNQDSLLKIEAQNRIDSISRQIFLWQHEYFSKNPSLLGFYEYFYILKRSDRMNLDNKELKKAHKFWLSEFPNHPLSTIAENLMNSKIKIKVGGNFIDFELFLFDERPINLSDFVKKNEFTILDLWAPWCGPCIKKSKKLKDNYEILESRNVKVVGIVGGVSEYSHFETAKNKYSYPWRIYPEINNKNKVWEKYGISNSGGSQFLISKTGKIIAVNADIDSILLLTKK